jgi:hypothetical protein
MDADHAIIVLVATKIATCSRLIGLVGAVTMMRRSGDYSSYLRRNRVSPGTEVAGLVL